MAEAAHNPAIVIAEVPPALTLQAWPYIEKWVARGVEYAYDTIEPSDIKRGLFEADFKLFVAYDERGKILDCSVVEVRQYPRKLCCNIIVVAGKANTMSIWGHEMYQSIENWAKRKGCKLMTGIGRRGWEHFVTTRYGFQKVRAMYSKVI